MNITDVLLAQMQRRPESLAVKGVCGDMSYGALGLRVLGASNGLLAAGAIAREVVAVQLVDPLDHWLATLALAHMGAIVLSLPRSMSDVQRERVTKLARCTRILVGDDVARPADGAKLRALDWSLVKNHAVASSSAPAQAAPNQPWLFVIGSGSTGRPKIMPITHQQQTIRSNLGPKWLPYGCDDVLLSLVSTHFYAAKQRYLEAMTIGASIFLDEPGRIDQTQQVANGDVTAIYGTVSHIEALLRSLPVQDKERYERLHALMVGGSVVSMALRERIRTRLTPRLYVLWGANECHTSAITRLSEVFSSAGGVGHPLPGIVVEVVDGSGIPVRPGVDGYIRVASAAVIDGYFDDGEATQKTFSDGWFYSGDIGHLTSDHQLVHRGRADDLMIVGGVNLYPAEIENCLRLLPGVRDVLATPLRHSVLQDVPVALIVPENGAELSAGALTASVRQQLGRHALHDVVFVEAIPRNEQGKVQREQVLRILDAKWGNASKSSGRLPAERSSPNQSDGLGVAFNLPAGAGPGVLADWLALLGEEELPKQTSDRALPAADLARVWLGQVLRLALALAHVLRIPVFDAMAILDCRPAKEGKGRWDAICRLPDSALVSRDVMGGVLKVAFGLAAWACKAKATDARDRDLFFRAIEKEILQGLAGARVHGESVHGKSVHGKSTFEVLLAAHREGIPYRRLAGDVFQLGWGSHARRIDRSTTDGDSAMGARWAHNKLATAHLLREAGLPAPVHQRVDSIAQAREVAERLGFPVVIKAADLERGLGVAVDVGPGGVEAAFNDAHTRSPTKTVIVEQHAPGVCHRLFIAAGQLLYAVKRLPIGVYSDGQSTIRELVDAQFQAQQLLPPWKRSGGVSLDDMAIGMLARQGWTPDSTPQAGRFVAFRRIETTAWGGVDEEFTNTLHPDNVRAALAAADLLGLEVAGVDMISCDITQPWHSNEAIINEVNYAPLLGVGEISRRYVATYLSRILKDNGRIPVDVFVGGHEAWKTAQERWEKLRASGVRAYLTTEETTLDGAGQAHHLGSAGLGERVKALMLRRDVQALVMVLQTDQALRGAPPLDRVSTFHVVDGDLRREQSEIRTARASDVAGLIVTCRAWWPCALSVHERMHPQTSSSKAK